MVLGPVIGMKRLSQILIVMLQFGNNNHQLMLSWMKLYFGKEVTVIMLMTWVVSTKTEKMLLMLKDLKIKEFMLLTITIPTKLV